MADKHSRTPRARVASVRIGTLEVEGIMDAGGNFYVAIPQIADLIETSRNTASRDLKRLMGEGFETSIQKVSTEFNQRPVNAVSAEDFVLVITRYALAGNPVAANLLMALAGVSIHQLFCDAFGQQFEAEDRQAFLAARMASKSVRSDFEEAIARWIERHPEASENTRTFAWINATQRIYMGMWGKCRKSVATEMGLSTGDDLRSTLTLQQLAAVQTVENLAIRLMDVADMEPMAAVDEAVNRAMANLIFWED